MDFSAKNDAQIEQWILNHERKNATGAPLYRELLLERARRGELRSSLKVSLSIQLLRTAAIEQRCVSYGDLAKESGVEWATARHRMNGAGGHLDHLLLECHCQGLPMLAALCVNKESLASGELEETALKGFAEGARRLGFTFGDERAFHRTQRDACWTWGRSLNIAD